MIQLENIEDKIHQHGFHIIDNFLNDFHYQTLHILIKTKHQDGHFRDAKIGHGQQAVHNNKIRTDKLCWLSKDSEHDALQVYFAAVNNISQRLNQALFLGLVDFESHFAVYNPGSFYKKHVDQFATTRDRRISCVYYLNKTWKAGDGGELILYDCDQDNRDLVTIQPIPNRFVCFRSEFPHEVNTTYQMRYSLVGWLKSRALNAFT
ncbi:2OG-Fe(II) oxygenase [Legionella oakridgensis]|uniref:SM-20-like protein n=2 Tax=Legionella oakridgensis TaxID=29423 RepID=A0A0W0XG52_9GAMM|nr:2OG-Fe(II) oxygenase [Legionella oakridgensis]AHE66034.1 putative proline hydroxylase [Legionella oakridgensis ATCC 33761 = DSM 21215]ETO94264.1 putative proline hydroxylase [Legionella oakridgensis RV-2-2007]KTD43559.1 SM-20-like protein [Legionella oakridgensis]STY15958.1 SM-20-like protein [Legionella longbeachae]